MAPDGSSVDAVRGVILALIAAGELDEDAADSITDRLNEVDRSLDRGQENRAADRLDQVRERVEDLRRDGDVNEPAYEILVASLDQLAGTIPSDNDNDNSGPGGGRDS